MVTTRPGHYLDPVFPPDGTKIVYGRVYDAMTMSEIGHRKRERKPFHFERWSSARSTTKSTAGCAGCGRPGCEPGVEPPEIPAPRSYR